MDVAVFSWLLVRYLDVIVVLASQPRGKFAPGPGTPLPQPTHFRRELQVLGGVGGGGRGGEEDGRRGRV